MNVKAADRSLEAQNHVKLSSCLEHFHTVHLYELMLLSWAVGKMIVRRASFAAL